MSSGLIYDCIFLNFKILSMNTLKKVYAGRRILLLSQPIEQFYSANTESCSATSQFALRTELLLPHIFHVLSKDRTKRLRVSHAHVGE